VAALRRKTQELERQQRELEQREQEQQRAAERVSRLEQQMALDRATAQAERERREELDRERLLMEQRMEEVEKERAQQEHLFREALEFPLPRHFCEHGYEKTINLAITGSSGAGKSSLINALRDLKPRDVGAADVGVEETTMDPMPYPFPQLPHVRLWDLPGAGTPRFPQETYLRDMGLRYFDIVIVVSKERFTQIDVMLLKELAEFGVPHFTVRTKIDIDVGNNEEDHGATEAETMAQIKNYLRRQGVDHPFLVSCRHKNKYDMPALTEHIHHAVQSRVSSFPSRVFNSSAAPPPRKNVGLSRPSFMSAAGQAIMQNEPHRSLSTAQPPLSSFHASAQCATDDGAGHAQASYSVAPSWLKRLGRPSFMCGADDARGPVSVRSGGVFQRAAQASYFAPGNADVARPFYHTPLTPCL
jgi:GTP-binding protein EngB required for normal cell division